ncbi:helix-turn-helix transcriptional regulator [Actinosynnema sp. NPDC020468]|uniref:helix-turn-helix transcriptional regulator n=1 Tax=Actinosynnema sp. NPDC020468 TaxID=3154488 RepID=UPI0033C69040
MLRSTFDAFGLRMRALREAQGRSLSAFAEEIHYSKGYVSRVETGKQKPSADFARQCDAALEAGGRLFALARGAEEARASEPRDDEGRTGLGRRNVLLGGAALIGALTRGVPVPDPRRAEENLAHHRSRFDSLRGLGQVCPPEVVLPAVVDQVREVRSAATDTRDPATRVALGLLLARMTEFAGWMAQEAGDTGAAAWWTGEAVRTAEEAGDPHTAGYALVRRALVTMYDGDADATIAYAAQAGKVPGTPARILGLAAQREAQGHALAADHRSAMRALEQAAEHLRTAAAQRDDGPTVGTTHVPDPVAVTTGWCLYDLGRPREAAEVLDREIDRIPITAVRARLRFGARQALAHAAAGNLERSCDLASLMVPQAATIGSATVVTDLRRLAAVLRRNRDHRAVRALAPAFGALFYGR